MIIIIQDDHEFMNARCERKEGERDRLGGGSTVFSKCFDVWGVSIMALARHEIVRNRRVGECTAVGGLRGSGSV